jgi:hypothetical protein
MNADSTQTTASFTFTLAIDIDDVKAGWLRRSSQTATTLNLVGRFEAVGGEMFCPADDPVWDGGTLVWCDSALDAIVLAAYEQHHGYRSTLLWDVAADAPSDGGHVVLTTRPHCRP